MHISPKRDETTYLQKCYKAQQKKSKKKQRNVFLSPCVSSKFNADPPGRKRLEKDKGGVYSLWTEKKNT